MAENIHLLEKEIHSSSDINLFKNGFFAGRITQLLSVFPSNSTHFIRIIREYNKKLNEFNLSRQILLPVNSGFGPNFYQDQKDIDTFFGSLLPARNQRHQGSSTSDVQLTWDADKRGVQVIKRGATNSDGTQDNVHAPSSDRRIRIFHKNESNYATAVLPFHPVRLRVSFTVTQNSGADINTTDLTSNRNPAITNRGIYFVYKDDDSLVQYPKYLKNKNRFEITTGFNAFEFRLYDDNDNALPAVDIMLHAGAIFDLDIKDIQIRYLDDRYNEGNYLPE